MSSPRNPRPLKAMVIASAGLLATTAIAVSIFHKRPSDSAPLRGERTKAASGAPTGTSEEQDFSDRRWQQRVAERRAEQQANAEHPLAGNEANGSIAANDPAGSRATTASGRDSGVPGDGFGSGKLVAGAAIRDDQSALRGGSPTSIVNARLPGNTVQTGAAGAQATKPTTGTSAGKPTRTDALGTTGGAKAAAVIGCGDGVLQAGEQCEPASSPKCGDDCTPVITDACYNCEVDSQCVPLASSCVDFTTNKLDQSLCYDVAHCIQDTHCAAGDRTLTSCFCGNMSIEECRSAPISGDKAPHGECADIIRDAMGLGVTNAYVLTHYTTASTPAGAAIRRFQCLKANDTCAPICFGK